MGWRTLLVSLFTMLTAACPSSEAQRGADSTVTDADVEPDGAQPADDTSTTDEATDADGEAVDDSGRGETSPGETSGEPCLDGFHRCGDDCVFDGDPDNCGDRCEPCPAPEGGSATCEAGTCGFTCASGLVACDGGCHDCPAPAWGVPSCEQAQCSFTCEEGYHRCGERCVDDFDPETCGEGCEPCPAPGEGGRATCDGRSCDIRCSSGYHRCTEDCRPDDSVDSCGDRCAPCPAEVPAHATPACASGRCTFACDPGWITCPDGGGCCRFEPRRVVDGRLRPELLAIDVDALGNTVLAWSRDYEGVGVEVVAGPSAVLSRRLTSNDTEKIRLRWDRQRDRLHVIYAGRSSFLHRSWTLAGGWSDPADTDCPVYSTGGLSGGTAQVAVTDDGTPLVMSSTHLAGTGQFRRIYLCRPEGEPVQWQRQTVFGAEYESFPVDLEVVGDAVLIAILDYERDSVRIVDVSDGSASGGAGLSGEDEVRFVGHDGPEPCALVDERKLYCREGGSWAFHTRFARDMDDVYATDGGVVFGVTSGGEDAIYLESHDATTGVELLGLVDIGPRLEAVGDSIVAAGEGCLGPPAAIVAPSGDRPLLAYSDCANGGVWLAQMTDESNCGADYHLCDGACVPRADFDTCGDGCTSCAAEVANGHAACVGGQACAAVCDADFAPCATGGGCCALTSASLGEGIDMEALLGMRVSPGGTVEAAYVQTVSGQGNGLFFATTEISGGPGTITRLGERHVTTSNGIALAGELLIDDDAQMHIVYVEEVERGVSRLVHLQRPPDGTFVEQDGSPAMDEGCGGYRRCGPPVTYLSAGQPAMAHVRGDDIYHHARLDGGSWESKLVATQANPLLLAAGADEEGGQHLLVAAREEGANAPYPLTAWYRPAGSDGWRASLSGGEEVWAVRAPTSRDGGLWVVVSLSEGLQLFHWDVDAASWQMTPVVIDGAVADTSTGRAGIAPSFAGGAPVIAAVAGRGIARGAIFAGAAWPEPDLFPVAMLPLDGSSLSASFVTATGVHDDGLRVVVFAGGRRALVRQSGGVWTPTYIGFRVMGADLSRDDPVIIGVGGQVLELTR